MYKVYKIFNIFLVTVCMHVWYSVVNIISMHIKIASVHDDEDEALIMRMRMMHNGYGYRSLVRI